MGLTRLLRSRIENERRAAETGGALVPAGIRRNKGGIIQIHYSTAAIYISKEILRRCTHRDMNSESR